MDKPKCSECDRTKREGDKGYYCTHPEIMKIAGFRRICRFKGYSDEMTTKTSPKWCPLRLAASQEGGNIYGVYRKRENGDT